MFIILLVNGDWGLWSGLSTCTSRCGGGTQTRKRLCDDPAPSNGGKDCPGLSAESYKCNTQGCPGKFKEIDII
jgi:hemicentin